MQCELNGAGLRGRSGGAQLQAAPVRGDQLDRPARARPGRTRPHRRAGPWIAGPSSEAPVAAGARAAEADRAPSLPHLACTAQHRDAGRGHSEDDLPCPREARVHLRRAAPSHVVHPLPDSSHGRRDRDERTLGPVSEGAVHGRDARRGLRALSPGSKDSVVAMRRHTRLSARPRYRLGHQGPDEELDLGPAGKARGPARARHEVRSRRIGEGHRHRVRRRGGGRGGNPIR